VNKSDIVNIQPSIFIIKVNKTLRFIKVGFILHVMALAGVFVFVIGLKKSIYYFNFHDDYFGYLWLFVSIYGFTIPFFAEFDANGRYQNYKQIKDAFYKMGYDSRLIKPFMSSRCQRDAVIVAAADLNYKNEVKIFFYKKGYRWYHVLPEAFLKNPLVIFKKVFWTRILFTKFYKLQNFYW